MAASESNLGPSEINPKPAIAPLSGAETSVILTPSDIAALEELSTTAAAIAEVSGLMENEQENVNPQHKTILRPLTQTLSMYQELIGSETE